MLVHQLMQRSGQKLVRNAVECVPTAHPFDGAGGLAASVWHYPEGIEVAVQYPALGTVRPCFFRWREIEWALHVGDRPNINRLPFFHDGVPQLVEPLGNGIGTQVSHNFAPPRLPFIIGELAFQVFKRPCDRACLFQEVADGRLGAAQRRGTLEILSGMAYGFQDLCCISDPLLGSQRGEPPLRGESR